MRFLYLRQHDFPQAHRFAFLCLLFFSSGLWARNNTAPHPSFCQNDIFQSAVFLENNSLVPDFKGEKIWFYTQHDNIRAYFTESGVLYKMGPVKKAASEEKPGKKEKEKDDDGDGVQLKYALIKMSWIGANPRPVIESLQKAPGYHTYIEKDDNSYKSFKTEGYKKLIYHDLYPGIDVEYSFPDKGGIEYTLIAKPGADLSQVKFKYAGEVKTISKNADGDIVISTHAAGDLTEHAPSTYYANGQVVASQFSITHNSVQFSFPKGYDKNQSLTIDPWVTALSVFTPDNMGFDVDYDTSGNTFAYGAGPSSVSDANNYFEVAKYNPTGTLIWTFNGSVASIGWNSWWSTGGNSGYNYAGNILVEKSTGKLYVGKGHDGNGTQAIRLNAAGAYDNFKSTINTDFQEDWGIGYNCVNSSLLALGGGVSSNINMALINTTTGATTNTNITTHPGSHQDIICGIFDDAGNLYVIMDDYTDSTDIPYWNTLYRVNAGLNGNVWSANSTYTTFSEEWNANFWQTSGSTNWNNCLAANGSYLFYYDGFNLKAFNLTTGAAVGNATTVAGNQATYEGGIAVDNCNNVYLGGVGAIKTFNFDGTNFNAGADIPLGGGFSGNQVEDIKYCSQNNTLYITGIGVVGTYAATASVNCNPLTVSNTCTSATATVVTAAEVTYTYTWTNSSGAVISQTANSTATSNTITGLAQGKYYVAVQWQANCNGSSIIDSVEVTCGSQVTVNDTTICGGQTALLTAVGTPSGGTYSWSPGGQTTDTISVSPTSTTSYTVTYTPTSGSPATAVSTVTIKTTGPTLTVNQINPDCKQTGEITAAATGGVSPYEYSINGGAYQDSGIFTPVASGSYTIMVIDSQGCINTASADIPSANVLASGVADSVICYGTATGSIIATATGGIAPYQYALDTGAYQTNNTFIDLAAGSYMIFTEDSNGCADSTTIQVFQPDSLYFDSITSTGIKCAGDKNGTITVIGGGGTPAYLASATTDSANFFFANNAGVIQGLDTGKYAVILSDANGCTQISSAYVPGAIADTFSYTTDSTSCYGSQYHDGAIFITAEVLQHAPYTYSLDNGAFQPSDTFASLAADTYQVVATDVNGCQTTISNIVVGQPPPAFAIAYPADTSLLIGHSVQLNSYFAGLSSSSDLVFSWTPSEGLSCVDCSNPIATPYPQTNIYMVTITYNHHCVADTSVLIKVSGGQVWAPNAFSPNGDGNNDVFYLYGDGIREVNLKIFNRWGEKVFETGDQFEGWDGTYKGVLQNPGVFVYIADVYFLDGTRQFVKGSITLIR